MTLAKTIIAEAVLPGIIDRIGDRKGEAAAAIADLAVAATGLKPDSDAQSVIAALGADQTASQNVRASAGRMVADMLAEQAIAAIQPSYDDSDGHTPSVVAGAVVLGLFAIIVAILVWPIPDTATEAVLLVVGALLTSLQQIVSFFFGSSKSSKDKTKALVGRMK